MEELLDANGGPRGWVREGVCACGKLKVSIFSISNLIDASEFRTDACSGSIVYN